MRFDVWHRRRTDPGEMQSRFLGHAATADETKAIVRLTLTSSTVDN
jgi:hypothetical protein